MENTTIPYIVYESTQAKNERIIKRLVVALIITVILMFAGNALWLYAWMQYDYVSEESTITYSQDGRGFNNINTGFQGDLDLIGDEDK